MHAIHLPPTHLLRGALLALLPALAVTLLLQAGRLDVSVPGGGSGQAAPAAAPAPAAPPAPEWAKDPLAPVRFTLPR